MQKEITRFSENINEKSEKNSYADDIQNIIYFIVRAKIHFFNTEGNVLKS